MKDPQRLLDGGGSAPELALLRAGDSEEPSESGKHRLAAALGVALGVTATASAATASQAAAGAAAGNALGIKLAAPWLVSLVGGVVLTGAAVTYVALPSEKAPPAEATTLPQAQTEAKASPRPAEPEATAPEALPPEQPAERVVRSAAAAPSGDSKSIAREIAALDEVRRSLAGGQPRKALEQLGSYGKNHPRGVLRQEATLLRIEALSRVGDRSGARRLADRFLSDNPKSPHARRVRALVGEAP